MKTLTLQQKANKIARAAGYLRATKIIEGAEDKIINTVSYGYRKNTTGEYVSNSYRSHFGWKNTYYQKAVVEVMVRSN